MATIAVFLLVLILLTPPLGAYMYRIYSRERVGRLEGLCYRVLGVNPNAEQSWGRYAGSLLWFSAVSMAFVFVILRTQQHLPLNPEQLPGVNPYLAFNTAASFMTNTNWQAYAGETTMSYLTQMVALTFQNFASAAVGDRRARRADTRIHPHGDGPRRQLLARSRPGDPLPPAAALDPVRDRADEPGRGADARRLAAGHGHAGVLPADRARPRRQPAGDQAARHERRRILQRELGASVREPDAAVEHPGAVRDPVDRVGADLHVRQVGRQRPPGVGAVRRHVDPADRRARDHRSGRARRHPRDAGGRHHGRAPRTSRARRSASARTHRPCGRSRPRPRPTAR